MHIRIGLVLFVSLSCAQLSAMDVEKRVNGVVVQYAPGYTASRLYEQLPQKEQKMHGQKLTDILTKLNNPAQEKTGSNIINLIYFKCVPELGLYFMQFAKSTSWDLVQGLVKDLPGFEALHDTEVYENADSELKDQLFKARLALLDSEKQAHIAQQQKEEEMRIRKEQGIERRTSQLKVYKALSFGQKSGLNKKSGEILIAAK